MSAQPIAISRDRRAELLAAAQPEAIQQLASRALELSSVSDSLVVTKAPETGLIMMQVREPVCKERFYLAEVVATRAEVLLHDQTGWAIRMGTDRPTALGAAILDAICEVPTDEYVEYVELHRSIAELCAQTIDDQAEAKAAEWNEISKTIVNFEALE